MVHGSQLLDCKTLAIEKVPMHLIGTF